MSKPTEIEVMPWYIVAGDDGLKKDCILVGSVGLGEELLSVRLYVSEKAMEEPQ